MQSPILSAWTHEQQGPHADPYKPLDILANVILTTKTGRETLVMIGL